MSRRVLSIAEIAFVLGYSEPAAFHSQRPNASLKEKPYYSEVLESVRRENARMAK